MASGKPSMMALLGLLAVAGYKHKDKLSDMLAGANADAGAAENNADRSSRDTTSGAGNAPGGSASTASKSGSLLTELASMFGGSAAGSTLSNGLTELVDKFNSAGQNDEADSWVGQGANRELQQGSLEQTLGEDTLAELSGKTGLSRADLLARLSSNIPDAVDRYSPDGRLPTEQEADRYR